MCVCVSVGNEGIVPISHHLRFPLKRPCVHSLIPTEHQQENQCHFSGSSFWTQKMASVVRFVSLRTMLKQLHAPKNTCMFPVIAYQQTTKRHPLVKTSPHQKLAPVEFASGHHEGPASQVHFASLDAFAVAVFLFLLCPVGCIWLEVW